MQLDLYKEYIEEKETVLVSYIWSTIRYIESAFIYVSPAMIKISKDLLQPTCVLLLKGESQEPEVLYIFIQ